AGRGGGEGGGLRAPKRAEGLNTTRFEGWTKGENKAEPLPLGPDKDVFGDGSVLVLRTPGHTPGHSSLLVRLPQMGAVILSGDAVHFRENFESDGVPAFNYDHAQTAASIARIKGIMKSQKAKLIIQHDARDVALLPVLPEMAK